jgi:hypothetical protein
MADHGEGRTRADRILTSSPPAALPAYLSLPPAGPKRAGAKCKYEAAASSITRLQSAWTVLQTVKHAIQALPRTRGRGQFHRAGRLPGLACGICHGTPAAQREIADSRVFCIGSQPPGTGAPGCGSQGRRPFLPGLHGAAGTARKVKDRRADPARSLRRRSGRLDSHP